MFDKFKAYNINDYVKVRLTSYGKEVFALSEYSDRAELNGDVLITQLWLLMQIFGKNFPFYRLKEQVFQDNEIYLKQILK